jgi:hypothetical protein
MDSCEPRKAAYVENAESHTGEKQKEVLDFVDFLKEKKGPKAPLRSLRGLWADLNIHISGEDIAGALREMQGNFSRPMTL